MSEVTYKDTHVTEAIDRLTQWLKDKASVSALTGALAEPAQDLEDVLRDLRLLRRIDTAQGEQLDVIGRIVDFPRDGTTDDLYRAQLRAWLLVLDSQGTIPNLVRVLLALFPDAEFLITPDIDLMTGLMVPGHLTVTFYTDLSEDEAEIARRFLREAKSAGIRFDFIYSPDVENAFTFTPDDTPTIDTLLGFADADTPTTGGYFIGQDTL